MPANANLEVGLAQMASWLENGYRITIPQGAVTDCDPHVLEVTAGGETISATFVRCDTTPEPFAFPWMQDVAVGTTVISEAAIITGIETAVPVTVLGGEYSIGCGSTYQRTRMDMPDESSACATQQPRGWSRGFYAADRWWRGCLVHFEYDFFGAATAATTTTTATA